MPAWTTKELRQLRKAHADGAKPAFSDLAILLPRHSPASIKTVANAAGLRHTRIDCRIRVQQYWLRLAHIHFAAREAEMGVR